MLSHLWVALARMRALPLDRVIGTICHVTVATRGFPSVRLALGILLGVNALMAVWTYYQYQRMLDYCAGFGGTGLECLGESRAAQLWRAVFFEVSVWFILEIAVFVVLGAALLDKRPPRVSSNAPR